MAANDLVTVAQVEAHFGIPTGTGDATQLGFQIEVASQMIEKYTKRIIKEQTFTEIYDGRRDNRLILGQWPVTSITEIRFDTESLFVDAETLVDSDDYRLSTNQQELIYRPGKWPIGYQNIKVVYDAGFATVPADIQSACLFLVDFLEGVRTNRNIGRKTKGKAGETTTLIEGIPETIATMLDSYRRIEFPQAEVPNRNA